MYAVVRNYEDEASDILERLTPLEGSITEVMSGIEGFVAYYLIDTGSGGVATISIYADRAGAGESTRAAGKIVSDHLVDWVPNPPTVIQGEVAITAAQ